MPPHLCCSHVSTNLGLGSLYRSKFQEKFANLMVATGATGNMVFFLLPWGTLGALCWELKIVDTVEPRYKEVGYNKPLL